MYSTKEKLNHFRQLQNPFAAEADLLLLTEKAPGNTNLTRYTLAPNKNGEDILFELLDVCTHDEIVLHRREFFAAKVSVGEESGEMPPADETPAATQGEQQESSEKAPPETKENSETSKKKKGSPSAKKKSTPK